jgi:hypothetical protein
MLSTNHGPDHGVTRRGRNLLAKEMYWGLRRKRSNNNQNVWPLPSYLRKDFLLDVLNTLFQRNDLSSHSVYHFGEPPYRPGDP